MNRKERRTKQAISRKATTQKVQEISSSLPGGISEIPICVYPSLQEVQLSAPDKKILSEDDFKEFCENSEKQIKDFESKSFKVTRVMVYAKEFFDWRDNVASQEIKNMPPNKQRATYAAFVCFKKQTSN